MDSCLKLQDETPMADALDAVARAEEQLKLILLLTEQSR
jgi:hypothetical protein